MQPSPDTASNSLPALNGATTETRRREDLFYQGMTIAAIALLLLSLGLF
jgi:hypothetical protein